jgi:23S rRNA pseudouridine1911/1915/1917 synthase
MTTETVMPRIVKICDDYLVVNKIPGESTEALEDARSQEQGTIIDLPRLLQKELGGNFLPTAVHRLDVPVSGCVLFARNHRSLAFFNSCFRSAEKVRKIYWGITEIPPVELPENAELIHWLEMGRGNRSIAFDQEGPGRKKAVLDYRVLGHGDRYLFLEINLITGRHHQIRAQLAHRGCAIKGDLKYGAKRSERGGGIRLHGYALSFPAYPLLAGEETITVNAPPPAPDGAVTPDNLWGAFMKAAGVPENPAGA